MIDNWTPAQDDIDWTRNHFDSMAVGDTWSVSGALLEKTDASELTLRQYPPESSMAIERVAAVCNQIDVKFESEGSELIEDPMDAAQKRHKNGSTPHPTFPSSTSALKTLHGLLMQFPLKMSKANQLS